MSSDICLINELSLARAREIVSPDFIPAYDWFIKKADTVGPRPWQEHKPEHVSVKMVAQSGIQKPAGQKYAISITSTGYENYSDQAVQDQGDGTWVFRYCEHAASYGDKSKVPYNESLIACLRDGVPVGVFIKENKAMYRCLGLAFVEEYDESTGEFILHGPVSDDQPAGFWSIVNSNDLSEVEKEAAREFENLEDDERAIRVAELVRRYGQQTFRNELMRAYDGACAMSSCDVPQALQAAHISAYRGPKSQLTSNGLLLRADLHLLYDAHLISIRPDSMAVEIAESLHNSLYADYDSKQIRIPRRKEDRPSEARLLSHYTRFKENAVLSAAPAPGGIGKR